MLTNFPRVRALLAWPVAPLVVSGVLYLAALAAVQHGFGVGPWPVAQWLDWGLHAAVAVVLWPAFRRRWALVLLLALLTALVHLGHAGKTAILGAPISPDDLYAFGALFLISAPWQRALLILTAALIVLALAVGIDWRRRRSIAVFVTLLGTGVAVSAFAAPLTTWMDRTFGYVDWNPIADYRRRGPAVHTLQETTRFLAERRPAPTAFEVAAALPPLSPHLIPVTYQDGQKPRNVHMIVLESFWDAGRLKAGLKSDPLPKDFRALWASTGKSEVLSPVFGGYTANAEFEALCGFPVTEPSVRFERKVTRKVPCLPAVLGQAGYISVASHPNIPAFWNRHNVYPRIGFDRFWAGEDFAYDETSDGFLTDRSLYRQVLAKIEPLLKADQPLFNYVLTIDGHLPYPHAETRSPRVTSRSSVPDVERYANTLYYKARELMAFLAELRQRDPEALIVVFGDHLPVLGERFAGYVESGLLAQDYGEFTPEMFVTYLATPLLIIDGRQGPIKSGRLPLYRLPSLLLERLGRPEPSLLDYSAPPSGMEVRPLQGLQLLLRGRELAVCREASDSTQCAEAAEWLARIDVLAADLFSGAQYALPTSPPALPAIPAVPGWQDTAIEAQPVPDAGRDES